MASLSLLLCQWDSLFITVLPSQSVWWFSSSVCCATTDLWGSQFLQHLWCSISLTLSVLPTNVGMITVLAWDAVDHSRRVQRVGLWLYFCQDGSEGSTWAEKHLNAFKRNGYLNISIKRALQREEKVRSEQEQQEVLATTRLFPIMQKNLPIILFFYAR